MEALTPVPAPALSLARRAWRILLVDDSPTIRAWMLHQLRNLMPQGLLLIAEDGRSALKQLSTQSVDLVVTDLRMPGMDGESFIQVLRRNPLLKRKPILVVSAEADAARAFGWTEEPGLRLLNKPVHLDDLKQALGELLGA